MLIPLGLGVKHEDEVVSGLSPRDSMEGTPTSSKKAEPVDAALIRLLIARQGVPTLVSLRDGRVLTVINIAWGYDDGDTHAHVTINISPGVPEAPIDFFLTHDVVRVRDPTSGTVLLEA